MRQKRLVVFFAVLLCTTPLLAQKTQSKLEPGIYTKENGKVVALVAAKTKQKGGSFLKGLALSTVTMGASELATDRLNEVFEGPSASLRLSGKPEFLLQNTTEFEPGMSPVFYTPDTYVLARLERGKKDRKVDVARITLFTGNFSSGVEEKDAVEFAFKKIETGLYSLAPKAPLPPGEYAFVPKSGMGPVYDFGVD
jgi:hypothetical protein